MIANGKQSAAPLIVAIVAQRFWRWWISELRGLLPPQRRRRLRPKTIVEVQIAAHVDEDDVAIVGRPKTPRDRRKRRLLPPSQEALDAADHGKRERRAVSKSPPWRGPTLNIPEALALRRRIVLPATAEADLEAILRFESAALFPFADDKLYRAHRIVSRAGNRLAVDVFAVERSRLDALCDRLSAIGLNPAHAVVGHDGPNLLGDGGVQWSRRLDWATSALAALAAVLGVVALHQPLERERAAVAALSLDVDAARVEAAKAQHLVGEIAALEEDQRLFAATFDGAISKARLLDSIAAAVPDDAWLTGFSATDDALRLTGRAASSNRLMAAFAGSPELASPTFPSPIVHDAAEALDTFELTATLKGRTEP